MRLTTTSHDATGEPATKEISDLYGEVVRTHLRALAEQSSDCAEEEIFVNTPLPRQNYQVWKATTRYLLDECGWSKWDCRTAWTITN